MDMERFYRENYNIVYGYLLSLCADVHLAEDLTSETFLRAILKIESYDGRVRASTWLCAIGRNLYFNERKKQKRRSRLEGVMSMEEYTMEEKLIQSQSAERIRAMVSRLEEPKRQVFLMRWQGMSFRDIGSALGKSENWARVTFFRAKERIMQQMEGLE